MSSTGNPIALPIHPLTGLMLQLIGQIFVYGFTSANSTWRILLVPFFIACSSNLLINGPNTLRKGFAPFAIGWSFVMLWQYVEVALRSKWDFEHQGPTAETWYSENPESGAINGRKARKGNGSFWERLRYGCAVSISFRDVNQPWHVRGVPASPTKGQKNNLTRNQFLLRKAVTLVLAYLYIDLIDSASPPPDKTLFADSKISILLRLHEVGLEEVIGRMILTIMVGIYIYSINQVFMAFPAFILVALNVHEPHDWPPLFGSASVLAHSFTLRRFWGEFWHQATRKLFQGNSHFLAHSIIRLPQHSLVGRCFKIFLSFLQSGLLHLAYDLASDIPLRESGALQFFGTQAFGIVLEQAVQELYSRVSGRQRSKSHTPLWAKVVGYVWVCGFLLVWSPAVWLFPTARREVEGIDIRLIPFSIFKRYLADGNMRKGI